MFMVAIARHSFIKQLPGEKVEHKVYRKDSKKSHSIVYMEVEISIDSNTNTTKFL